MKNYLFILTGMILFASTVNAQEVVEKNIDIQENDSASLVLESHSKNIAEANENLDISLKNMTDDQKATFVNFMKHAHSKTGKFDNKKYEKAKNNDELIRQMVNDSLNSETIKTIKFEKATSSSVKN